ALRRITTVPVREVPTTPRAIDPATTTLRLLNSAATHRARAIRRTCRKPTQLLLKLHDPHRRPPHNASNTRTVSRETHQQRRKRLTVHHRMAPSARVHLGSVGSPSVRVRRDLPSPKLWHGRVDPHPPTRSVRVQAASVPSAIGASPWRGTPSHHW